MSIPRYKVNTLWGWYGFVQDDEKGKFCEYRDYINLKSEFDCDADSHRLIMDSNRLNASMWKNQVANLNAKNARLEALTVEMDKTINISQSGCRELKAEVERLTKAGDRLAEHLDERDFPFSIEAWNAAKEGKQ